MDIVFFGEDTFSNVVLNSLIESQYTVKYVITPYYDNFEYKKIEFTCLKNNVPFLRAKKINSPEVRTILQEVKPDLCIVAHFKKLISKDILKLSKLGFINVHPSLLPNYRGMSPQHWPIINGDSETGVTVHFIDEGVDTGDIIIQEKILITKEMYVSDLQREWIKIYKWIVLEAINRIAQSFPLIVQKDKEGCYYGKLKQDDCIIHDSFSVLKAFNLIKGVSFPYQGANYKDVIIYKAHIYEGLINYDINNIQFGISLSTIIGNVLRLKDGIIIIEKYKDERKNY